MLTAVAERWPTNMWAVVMRVFCSFSFSPVGAFENQAMLEPWEMMCKGLGKAWSGGEEEGK